MEERCNILAKQLKKIDESSRRNINSQNVFSSFRGRRNSGRVNYNNIDIENVNYDLRRNNSKVKRRVRRINT